MRIYQIYETERLLLRPTHLEDAAFVFELVNMPKWKKYIGDRQVHNVEQARQYITDRMLPQLHKVGFGNFTVIRKSDGQKIGSCGLYQREGLDVLDIGFAFLTQYEKQGYAYESTSMILQLAQNQFELKRISAITTQDNIASQRLLQKLGLLFVKNIRLPKDEALLQYFEIYFK